MVQGFKSPGIWIYACSALFIGYVWYRYAFGLGQVSGLSFFVWGKNTDRISLTMLFEFKVWLDLFLRITIRNLAIIGLPLTIIGFYSYNKDAKDQTINAGLIGMLICTSFAIRSSAVHEYYQLPLQLFFCPLMGRGWIQLESYLQARNIVNSLNMILLILICAISFTVLFIDYFRVENSQTKIWMPLAKTIRKEVEPGSRIVTVTALDPTLLNLARRQGWLTTASNLNEEIVSYWLDNGAKYLAGSLNWQESYIPLAKDKSSYLKRKIKCNQDNEFCFQAPGYTYLIPLKNLLE